MYKSDCYLFFLPNSLFSNYFRGSNRAVTKHSVRCVNPWNSIAFCMLYLAMAPTREHCWTEFIKNYIKYGYTYRWHKELLFSPAFLSQRPWFIFAFSTFASPGYPLVRFDRLNESRAICIRIIIRCIISGWNRGPLVARQIAGIRKRRDRIILFSIYAVQRRITRGQSPAAARWPVLASVGWQVESEANAGLKVI